MPPWVTLSGFAAVLGTSCHHGGGLLPPGTQSSSCWSLLAYWSGPREWDAHFKGGCRQAFSSSLQSETMSADIPPSSTSSTSFHVPSLSYCVLPSLDLSFLGQCGSKCEVLRIILSHTTGAWRGEVQGAADTWGPWFMGGKPLV